MRFKQNCHEGFICDEADSWGKFCELLQLAQPRGITVKITPVPERDDATTYRGFIVIELCDPPTRPDDHSCYFTAPAIPSAAVEDALHHLQESK